MEFKDYYAILNISSDATFDEIRSAYRKASQLWHPDHNQGRDTTMQMQDINEAYLILKDIQKRVRYDAEYKKYKASYTSSHISEKDTSCYEYDNYEYTVSDDEVYNDMQAARKTAKDLVEEFVKNLRKDGHNAAVGAWEEIKGYLIGVVILMIIGLFIVFFI